MRKIFILLSFISICHTGIFSQTAHFRGEQGDGKYAETGLLKSWPETGPECVMTVEGIGKGFSSAVVSDGTIYVTGMKEAKDYLTAINPDGKIKWQVPFGNSWTKSFPDTRCTPTVEGDRIYVLSGTGRLACIDTKTGQDIWSAETDSDFESKWHEWGVAESILLVDNLAICTPAGKKAAVVAYDKMTGKLVWQTPPTEGQRSYVTPVIYKYKDIRYILASTTKELIAIVPSTGKVAWIFTHWQADRDPNEDGGQIYTNNPTINENEIYLTRGYDYPGMMLTVSPDGKSISEKWIDKTLDNHHHGVINTGGFIYGSNWINNGKGNWVCLDWNTGEVKWEQPWNNKGPAIFADGLLYIMDEKSGNVGLVKPDPAKFDLISSFKITGGTGPYWAHPAIYDSKLLIRHGDMLMVYRIK